MTTSRLMFPKGFAWGAATAAYQIEGAWNVDGRGESIWDRFSHTAGKTLNGDTGDVACDHYRRFAADVGLMRQLGLKAYRCSISWPRVMPDGKGPVNWLGLDFYDRLVDSLLTADIEPHITLYHWDLPQALQDKGGWENRDTCQYFADYAAVIVSRLADRVKFFSTLNEPWVIANLGYKTGEHAPGIKDEGRALRVSHNLMLAHGLAVQAMRAQDPGAKCGVTLFLAPAEPASDAPEDREAAEFLWQKDLGWFLGPIFKAHYPPEVWTRYGELAPDVKPGDLAIISQHLDFLGVNYYFRNVQSANGLIKPVPGSLYTDMDWEIHAPALRRLLVRLKNDYQVPPTYITENGCAVADVISADGKVHDPQRIQYLQEHLEQLHLAITDGVDLRGYLAWSLMDNFEWAYGYSKRFGLVYVDYPTQKRIVKDSGEWYSRTIKANGVEVSQQAAVGR